MFVRLSISSVRVMVTIVLSGIAKQNDERKNEISSQVFFVLNNLESKYRIPLLIYIPILLPFNLIILSMRLLFGEKFFNKSIKRFYSMPINKKVYRLIRTLSLLIFYTLDIEHKIQLSN